ncbi:CBS domain-containing protein [Desulforegula conservatrix]|uniref:CBS domain-containing protein n=1 Tax=Desulforegula conservatrix TaxID=153026 RepID=UPI000427E345|nr:CBS domain-containing protein [Desulforegula conservatrix]
MEYSLKNITIITTHINADFDAVASLLAAQKLYPDSIVVFPGSQEKKLRDFFISSMAYLFKMADINAIDMDTVARIVLVDTANSSRIGTFAEICVKDDVELHIFDHHPKVEGDLESSFEIRDRTGATVTLLTEIIKQKGIPLSPEEATILCLGIYEDTGSFSFPSTTERDFLAAAFLLSKGASLNTISDIIAREINPFQLSVLNDMIQAAERRRINGIEIVITKVSSEKYINDLAYLTHKMVKMEAIDVIFTLAQIDSKIQIVARSRIPEVNVAFILSFFGGGGHPYAASATVKNTTQTDMELSLIDILLKNVRSSKTAKALMSSPAIKTTQEVTCENAAKILTRYNVNALLIIDQVTDSSDDSKEKLIGFITRQVIDKAISHGLGHLPVREYMNPEIVSVDPEADLSEIHSKIIASNQRILPVVENSVVIGVVTRTDLIKTIDELNDSNSFSSSDHEGRTTPKTKHMSSFMKERLPEPILELLAKVGEIASDIGYNAYVVGGFVRDLLLYEKNFDIDIVIEGDGISFAQKFGELHNANVHTYTKFGTAVITMPDGFKIDVASARLEYYQHPGALPTVERSSIKLDMYRRDFTMNTLAIQLNPEKFGVLIDFFAAQKDIKDKVIRVIHNLSFVEDPTRIFRAIRFEQRFGFTIGKLSASLIQNALKFDFLHKLSGIRIFSELKLILEEDNPAQAIQRIYDLGLMNVIHPALIRDKYIAERFSAVKKVFDWYELLYLEEPVKRWTVYFMVLIRYTNVEISEAICRRLELPPKYIKLFCHERMKALSYLHWIEMNQAAKNHEIFHKLTTLKTESILFMMAATNDEAAQKTISRFYTTLKNEACILSGKNLVEMGLEPGPTIGKILLDILNRRLDGEIKSKEEEAEAALELINKISQ